MTDHPNIEAVVFGRERSLIFEERQYYEPAAYCHESGSWCVANEDNWLYFVSDDGRVDIHDPETFRCLHESAGATKAAHEAYWDEQARDDEAKRRGQS